MFNLILILFFALYSTILNATLSSDIEQKISDQLSNIDISSINIFMDNNKNISLGLTLKDVIINNNKFVAIVKDKQGLNQELKGLFKIFANIPVLNKRIYKGHIIQEEDIITRKVEFSLDKFSNIITQDKKLIGKESKAILYSKRFIKSNMIINPYDIRKKDMVNIIFKSDLIQLRVKGKALESGRIGDIIKIENIDSKKIVLAKIITKKSTLVVR